MNKKTIITIRLLIVFIVVACLFILTEFTDKYSKVLPFDIHLKLKESFLIPSCLNNWMEGNLTSSGLFVGIICFITCGVFVYFLIKWIQAVEYQNRRTQNLKLLGSMMLLFWSIGWALYLQAFLYFDSDHLFVNSELLLRSAIASLDLFMLDIDSNVLDKIGGHAHLKGMISFVSLLSFACTAGLLISLISARLWAYMKLWLGSRVNSEHPHLYLFWGLNKNMELLADSIKNNDEKSIRIFIEKTKSDEDDGNEGWNHLINLLSHRREAYKKVKELDARLALTGCRLCNLTMTDGVMENCDIWAEIGLNDIKKKIDKLGGIKGAELHLFFLSDNEAENIESVSIIRNDNTIKEIAKNKNVKVVIYCHARYDNVNRVIESTSLSTDIDVRIVDSAHIAVEELKSEKNISLQPVSFVRFDKNITTDSAFNALVVGFGSVGQDALRFLYEYGAFASSDQTDGIKRSPFCCHVVDSNMNNIAPTYKDTHLRMEDPNASIILHSYNYMDQAFFDLLNDICIELNYIVIAVGDDIEGVKLAISILKHVVRQKKDLRNFKILIKSYSPEKIEHIDKIIEYYNGLFLAEMVSRAKEPSDNKNESDQRIIHIFGRTKEIYSFQSIVSNELRRESWLYYNSYNGVIEKTDKDFAALSDEDKKSGQYCSVSEPDWAWNIRRENVLKNISSPNYSDVMSLRRKEAQDIENAHHRHTKRVAVLKAFGNDTMLLKRIETGIRNKTITRDEANYYWDNQKKDESLNTLMTSLAQMEHLRWCASHQMLGYIYATEKDEAKLEHDCLVEWDKLVSDKVRGYDYDVVDRSFRLADEQSEKMYSVKTK